MTYPYYVPHRILIALATLLLAGCFDEHDRDAEYSLVVHLTSPVQFDEFVATSQFNQKSTATVTYYTGAVSTSDYSDTEIGDGVVSLSILAMRSGSQVATGIAYVDYVPDSVGNEHAELTLKLSP